MFHVSQDLIHKYSVIGPRYTSYPTAPIWGDIDPQTHYNWLKEAENSSRGLSLYIHIPFCRDRCMYCGCNVVITRQQKASADYLMFLLKEIETIGKLRKGNNTLRQLHFGGGTPNFLLNEEFEEIMAKLKEYFLFTEETEIGIEIDPCSTRPGQLEFLAKFGVNRLSLGVQDLDEKVQQAVNRVQSREITLEHLQTARQLGIKGINFDLIYGLPFQSVTSFRKTVDDVISMQPDRLAVYNFGYLPNRMIHQRKIKAETLPDTSTKLDILLDSINRFTNNGYNYIGMDHFALPNDELSIAQKNRTLYRNFMGYTPKSGVDLYGLGMTGISEIGPYFIQNEKKLKGYKQAIEKDGLSGSKGMKLSENDLVRKWVIMRLICHFYLDFKEFSQSFGTPFEDLFSKELDLLGPLQEDGLIVIDKSGIKVVNHGQILVRNVCMVFDSYLNRDDVPKVKYSTTI